MVMAEDIYIQLREFLHSMPGGFPESGTGVELRILKKLFTPEQAEAAILLSRLPEPIGAIAARTGRSAEELRGPLESMADEGSIMRLRLGGESYYMAINFIVGIFEFHLKSIDREFAELLEEYEPTMQKFMGSVKTKQMRVIPIEAALKADNNVAIYDNIRETVKQQELLAVADCICRVERSLKDQPCRRPLETCFVFGVGAQYYIDQGLGRQISREECLAMLDKAEEAALVLCPGNTQDMYHVCSCCSCCCGMLRGLRSQERPADHASSTYRAVIDSDLCTACGTCMGRCQMEAIAEGDDFYEISEPRCIGCGLCVPTCPAAAVSLIPKAEALVPPHNMIAMGIQIAQERGLV